MSKELILSGNPFKSILSGGAARDDIMDMRMKSFVPFPGMKDAGKSDIPTEVFSLIGSGF